MSFDWEKIMEGKRALRRDLAARPVAEKLRMLDAMRGRELAIRGHVDRTKRQAFVTKVMEGATDYRASNDEIEAQAGLDRPRS
jgi:hypothetical protein